MVHEMLGITNGRVRIDGEEKLELRVHFLSSGYLINCTEELTLSSGPSPLDLFRPFLRPKHILKLW